MIKKSLSRLYMTFIFILLYSPIAVLIILSFNASKTRAKWGGFTLKWYLDLFSNQSIMNALYNSLIIALLSALISTLIALISAVGIQNYRRRTRNIVIGISNIPMINADIVTGISLMLMFIAFGVSLNSGTVLIAHITFNIPYAMLCILPRYKSINVSTYEAALDLGATPLNAFLKVVLPDLIPGIASGFLMAFTMSLDDFVITHFTKGPGFDTLSTKIYTEVKKGIKPEMYSLSTLLFISVFILLILINKLPAKKEEKGIEAFSH